MIKDQFPGMPGCALTPIGVAELADNFVSAETVFDPSVPC